MEGLKEILEKWKIWSPVLVSTLVQRQSMWLTFGVS